MRPVTWLCSALMLFVLAGSALGLEFNLFPGEPVAQIDIQMFDPPPVSDPMPDFDMFTDDEKPESITNERVVELLQKHPDEILAVWNAMDDEACIRDAVQLWLKDQGDSNEVDIEVGTHVLLFSASWCGPCKSAKERLGDLLSEVVLVDIDERKDLAKRYGVTNIPVAVLVEDGKAKTRCIGNDVGPLIVGKWLK